MEDVGSETADENASMEPSSAEDGDSDVDWHRLAEIHASMEPSSAEDGDDSEGHRQRLARLGFNGAVLS